MPCGLLKIGGKTEARERERRVKKRIHLRKKVIVNFTNISAVLFLYLFIATLILSFDDH